MIPLCETTQQLLHKNGGNLSLWIFYCLNSQVMFQKVCVLYYWTPSIIQALLNCQLSKATFSALSKGHGRPHCVLSKGWLMASVIRPLWHRHCYRLSQNPSLSIQSLFAFNSAPIKLSSSPFLDKHGENATTINITHS